MVFNFRPEVDSDSDELPPTYTWLIRFSSAPPFDQMQQGVTTALFEGKWGSGAWNKLKEDEREYQRSAYVDGDAEMEVIDEEDEEQPTPEEEEEESEDEDEGEVESGESPAFVSRRKAVMHID